MKSHLVARFTWLVFENRTNLEPVIMEYYAPYDSEFLIASRNDLGSYKLLEIYSNKYKRVVNEYGTWKNTNGLKKNIPAPIYFKRLDMNQTNFNMINIPTVNFLSLTFVLKELLDYVIPN